jgi:hypothetical protein
LRANVACSTEVHLFDQAGDCSDAKSHDRISA